MAIPSCQICKGWGVSLATNMESICAHCARIHRTRFDPDEDEYCQQGYIDISPKADGGVLKKLIKEGEPGKSVQDGCPSFVQYIGRLTDGSIFDTTRDIVDGKHVGGTDDEFEFKLGHGKVIQGWEIAVATMNKGEISRFIIRPEYGYGQGGFAPKVEPNATLDYEIELIRYGAPLPKFPSKSELDATKREREAEERRQYEENPPPSIAERVKTSMQEKEKGNMLVAKGKWEEAKNQYDSGFIHIYIGKEEWEHILNDEEKALINGAKKVLHLNRGLCKLKLEKYDDALWDCDQSILIDDTNMKAHFRRALCYIAKLKGELAKEKEKKFWLIEKGQEYSQEAHKSLQDAMQLSTEGDKQFQKTLLDLERCDSYLLRYEKQYKNEEKKLYKEKIMDKLERQNRRRRENHPSGEDPDEFLDMPALE